MNVNKNPWCQKLKEKSHARQCEKKHDWMISEQRMTQVKMPVVIEGTKAAIMTVREKEIPIRTTDTASAMTKTGDLMLKQPTFN